MDPCFIHCHIAHEKILFIVLKQLQTALWIVDAFLFLIGCEKTRYPFRSISNRAFSCSNVHAKWCIYCLLISSRCQLSHATSIYVWLKPFCGLFLCTDAFKISKPFLYHLSRWSRVWITLVKPLLCLNGIFSIKKQCFINTRNSDFSIVLKITKVTSLKPL